MHDRLRGEAVASRDAATQSISHSSVLAPERRNPADAFAILDRLVQKAAMRLRSPGTMPRACRWVSSTSTARAGTPTCGSSTRRTRSRSCTRWRSSGRAARRIGAPSCRSGWPSPTSCRRRAYRIALRGGGEVEESLRDAGQAECAVREAGGVFRFGAQGAGSGRAAHRVQPHSRPGDREVGAASSDAGTSLRNTDEHGWSVMPEAQLQSSHWAPLSRGGPTCRAGPTGEGRA